MNFRTSREYIRKLLADNVISRDEYSKRNNDIIKICLMDTNNKNISYERVARGTI